MRLCDVGLVDEDVMNAAVLDYHQTPNSQPAQQPGRQKYIRNLVLG